MDAIHHLMRKFKIKKRDVRGGAIIMYLDTIKSDRDFSIQLRKDFEMSVFEVGFANWFLYEFLNLKPRH